MNILLLDDEAVAARRLERLTRRILGEDIRLLAVIHGLSEARRLLAEERFDLILLDLSLAGEDGFDLLVGDVGRALVVIVSAHPGRAIEAFGHAVLDFVPKPVTENRLRQALERFRRALGQRTPERLVVRAQGRANIVDVASVVRIVGADDYSELLLANGRTLLCDRRLSDLIADLPSDFVQVHRSFVINFRHVEAFEQTLGGPRLRQPGGVVTPVSRRRLNNVKARLRGLDRDVVRAKH